MKSLTILGILVALLFTQTIHASVIEYGLNDRDEWFADVGGPGNVSTVDFTGYADFTPISDQWADLGVHFSGFVVTIGEDFIGLPTDGWGVRGEPDINITFDYPINWIAVDLPGYTTVELYSDDQLIYSSSIWGFGGPGHFGGLISDIPFDRVRFGENDVPIEFLDNIHFGPPIAVPGPGAIGCLSVCLIISRRRRR